MLPVRLALSLSSLVAASAVLAATPATRKAPAGLPTAGESGTRNAGAELAALRAKAERGNGIAQYNLGLAYAEGRQTAVDLAEAFVWLKIAADSGSTGRALESLLARMSTAQITEGERRLAALRADNPFVRPPPTPPASRDAGAAENFPTVATAEALPAPAEDANAAAAPDNRLAPDAAAATSTSGPPVGGVSATAPANSAELAALQRQLKEVQDALAARTEVANSAAARARRFEALAFERARTLEEAQTQLEAARSELAAKSAMAGSADSVRAELEKERAVHAETARELARSRVRLEIATREAARAAAQAASATAAMNTLTTTQADSTATIAAREAAMRQLASEQDSMRRKLEDAQRELAAATAEKGRLAAALETAEAAARAAASSRSETVADRERLEAAARAAAGQNAELRTRLEALEAGRTALETERQQLTARVTELAAERETALRGLTVEQDALRARVGAAEQEASLARAELARVNELLAAARSAPVLREPTRPTTPPVPVAAQPRVHVIAVGETLIGISRQYYGTPNRWPDIAAANRDWLRDERSLIAGRTLVIP